MLNTFNSRLTRTTPRWFVMPVLGAAAGAALISLAASAGTLPAVFASAASPGTACHRTAGACTGADPAFKVPQIQVPRPAPLAITPKGVTNGYAVSPMTRSEQAHKAALQARLGIVSSASTGASPTANPGS